MSIVAIGCNHRTTPLAKLEQMSVAAADLPKALASLSQSDFLSEVVVLSTCNRVEVYATFERYHDAHRDVREFLSLHSGLPPEVVADNLFAFHDTEAVKHLFSVAAGLDSAVVGEHEVLGQVKVAWQSAIDEKTSGAVLADLFRHAIKTGKRVRTATKLGRGLASVSAGAVELASAQLGGIAGRSFLVVGAGSIAKGTAKALAKASAGEIVLANRSLERAQDLAGLCGGKAIPLSEMAEALATVDVLITASGSPETILTLEEAEDIVAARQRPLVVVDIAVPRNVDPAVGQIEGVTLLNIEDIGELVDANMLNRKNEVASAQEIVEAEVERYEEATLARQVATLLSGLHERGSEIRRAELDRITPKLAGLTSQERTAVEAATNRIVKKLLHNPSKILAEVSGSARGERLAESLRELFDL